MRAYLSLGSNIGDRHLSLQRALYELDQEGVRVLARSSVYETEPVGGPRQPLYLNQVVEVETTLDPHGLLETLLKIESRMGRDEYRGTRWGPRPIDLDILVIEGETVDDPSLVVPHRRLAERAFVLVPLSEIAPDLDVPGVGRADELLARLGPVSGVRRLA